MTINRVGYKLIKEKDNSVVQQWGGIWGQSPAIPDLIVLPNGDQIWAPELETLYQGYKLIVWEMEPPAPPVPSTISNRQFFQQAAIDAIITKEEAISAVQTGAIPTKFLELINSLESDDEKFASTMLISGATSFDRNHFLIEQFRKTLNKTNEEIDEFFRKASAL